MLRCTIELIPGGVEDHPRRKTIGVVEIANVGGSHEVGSYKVVLKKTAPFSKASNATWRKALVVGTTEDEEAVIGDVEGFECTRLGPYDLLFRALRACVGVRNP